MARGKGAGRRRPARGAAAGGALQEALALHRSGRVAAAERLYRRVLDDDPGNAEALHYLGVAALQQERAEEAARLIGAAAARRPDDPQVLNNLGEAYRALKRTADAAECYRRAIALDATDPAPHNNLGNVLAADGKAEEAAAAYRRALALAPDDPEVLSNLGGALLDAGRPGDAVAPLERAIAVDPHAVDAHLTLGNLLAAEGDFAGAAAHYRRALAIAPDNATALTNLGNALGRTDEMAEAIACHRRAIAIDPGNAAAHNNLGEALHRRGDDDAAVACFARALECDPDSVGALVNLGRLLRLRGRVDEAAERFRRALAVAPDRVDTVNSLGGALMEMGMADAALDCYRRALAKRPDNADLHMHFAIALMRLGRLAESWPEYEWRWRTAGQPGKPAYPEPEWQGAELAGKTILVWGEQGIGDEVLYAGMVPDLIARGATVVVECEPRLAPLFSRSFSGATCVARRQPPAPETRRPDIDFQVAIGSLGRWLRPDLASFPGRPSYLVADAAKRARLRDKYKAGDGGFLVGIAWFSKNAAIGGHKSLALRDLAPLAAIPGVTLVDLQYGDTAAERKTFAAETGAALIHDDSVDQMRDLDAFAAQVAAMDLVITISNATAHIAGALGVPAWVLLHTVPRGCWMLEREDSPWYPSVRLFRQARRGHWSEVIDRVAAALGPLAGGG